MTGLKRKITIASCNGDYYKANGMKKSLLILFFVFLTSGFLSAQTNLLHGNIASFNLQPRTNMVMILQVTWPLNRTIGNQFISNDPLITSADTNGNFYFTNVAWGRYKLYPRDSTSSYWMPQIGTNTIGAWELAALSPLSAAIPPNPATNYYTQAQVDALIAGAKHPTFDMTIGATFDQN